MAVNWYSLKRSHKGVWRFRRKFKITVINLVPVYLIKTVKEYKHVGKNLRKLKRLDYSRYFLLSSLQSKTKKIQHLFAL